MFTEFVTQTVLTPKPPSHAQCVFCLHAVFERNVEMNQFRENFSVGVHAMFLMQTEYNVEVDELIDRGEISKVAAYIRATIKHKIPDELNDDNDLKFFLDMDLSILGSPQEGACDLELCKLCSYCSCELI